MKQITFLIITTIFLSSCNFQSTEKNSVDLYQQYSADGGYNVFYEKDSETPYSGKLVSESKTDKVLINFKNGKMDGAFIRLKSNGDTLELRKYSQGAELYSIHYKYEDGELVERKKSEKEKGDSQDFEIFTTALNLIRNKQFNELDEYLNPLSSSYESTFLKLESLFGSLQDFKVKEINKEYVERQNSEHLSAKIDLNFQDKFFEVGFLIVEYPKKLKGQAFSLPSFDYELIKDNNVAQIINSLNNKDVDQIIEITRFTEQHREILLEDFEKIDKISGNPKFLNCHFAFLNETLLMKDYLVTVGDERQVLALTYKIDENHGIELMKCRLLPYRKPYMVMHKIF